MWVRMTDKRVVVLRARPCCGAHTLEWCLFETVAREWKQLFSLSYFHSSALNISHGLLWSISTSLCSSVFCDHVIFFFPIFSFPSLSLLVSSLHILMLSQSAVSTAPVGAELRVIFSGCVCVCVCVWTALIFYLRQVHISPVWHAGL